MSFLILELSNALYKGLFAFWFKSEVFIGIILSVLKSCTLAILIAKSYLDMISSPA